MADQQAQVFEGFLEKASQKPQKKGATKWTKVWCVASAHDASLRVFRSPLVPDPRAVLSLAGALLDADSDAPLLTLQSHGWAVRFRASSSEHQHAWVSALIRFGGSSGSNGCHTLRRIKGRGKLPCAVCGKHPQLSEAFGKSKFVCIACRCEVHIRCCAALKPCPAATATPTVEPPSQKKSAAAAAEGDSLPPAVGKPPVPEELAQLQALSLDEVEQEMCAAERSHAQEVAAVIERYLPQLEPLVDALRTREIEQIRKKYAPQRAQILAELLVRGEME